MNRFTIALATTALSACLFVPHSLAQDAAKPPSAEQQAMMEAWQKAAAVGPQHKQLAEHFVGTWNTKQTMWMDPAAPPMVETGKAVTTAELGGRHMRMTFASQWMGEPFEGVGLTSYDNIRGKYVSSWVDSGSTGQFLSEGSYDPASKTYTFTSKMDDPMKPGTKTPVREVVRMIDTDHHVMEWYETRDGKERKSMVIEYSRAQ